MTSKRASILLAGLLFLLAAGCGSDKAKNKLLGGSSVAGAAGSVVTLKGAAQ